MPKNVGRYEQGGIAEQAPMGYEHGGSEIPPRAKPAPAPPKNQVPVRSNGRTVGNNDSHKV